MVIDFEKMLSEKGYLKSVKEENSLEFEVIFEMRNGYQIPLIIIFTPLYPSELPIVKINEKYHVIPNIPHVMTNGLICFLDKEGVIWSDLPERTLDFVFERVERVLTETSPQIEYHREFSYYFGSLNKTEPVMSVYSPEEEPEEISVLTLKNKPFAFLKDDKRSVSFLSKLLGTNINSHNLDKAYFIPLEQIYNGTVPQLDRFWSNEEICKIVIEHISEDTLTKIRKFNSNKKKYFYLLRIPLLTGEHTIIGLWYEKVIHNFQKKVNPLIDESVADYFEITPLFVFRNDDTTLVQRGGGIKQNPNILLIGCGSVGSDLLFMLSRSGIKKFTLIDDDKLEIENSYRHFLGMNKTIYRKPKVELLKEEFESRYPNLHINTIKGEVLETIEKKEVDLDSFDLIIVAIGDANIERRLNKHILETSTPCVFTWVEAYGIGGHALMVNNGKEGCYECLIDKELKMYPSFAGKSDVPFIKNVNGCAGSFTPYGGVDSMETAIVASRLVLRYFKNGVKGNPLISWKGTADGFKESGFSTSERYEQSLEVLTRDNFSYINSSCKICSLQEVALKQ
jgi:molybdopterin/thiamine biosynthesis adenylyltransferase